MTFVLRSLPFNFYNSESSFPNPIIEKFTAKKRREANLSQRTEKMKNINIYTFLYFNDLRYINECFAHVSEYEM